MAVVPETDTAQPPVAGPGNPGPAGPALEGAELVRAVASALRFARWTGADVVDRAWARPLQEPPPAAPESAVSHTAVPDPAPARAAPRPASPAVAQPARAAPPAVPVADAAATLARLRERLDGCTRCPHAASRGQIVHGQGNPQARLLVVGDAPGPAEDAAGAPFQGPAGELLDRMLAAIGLQRADVWLTTITLCAPAPGAGVHPQALATCSPFLRTQLEAVKPQVVLLMGEASAQFLLRQQQPLSALRGQWQRLLDRPVLATWPPGDLLQDPGKKREAWADLQRVRDALNGG